MHNTSYMYTRLMNMVILPKLFSENYKRMRLTTRLNGNSERYTSDGRDHLSIQSDLCRQNQSVLNELEGHNPGHMGNSDSDTGLPNPLHIWPNQCSSPPTPYLSSEDIAVLEEETLSLLQKQVISQIPGIYSNMLLVPKKDDQLSTWNTWTNT